MLTLALLFTSPSWAYAAPATGGISGTVYSQSTGDPVAVAAVAVEPADIQIFTDSNGTYKITGIPPGTYHVRFSGELTGGNYLTQWYSAKADEASADPVVVAAGATTTGVDANLRPGGLITGRVTDSAGRPVPNAEVSAFNSASSAQATTNSQGAYLLQGLVSGAYEVDFDAPAHGLNYAAMAYHQKPQSSPVVDLVAVTEGRLTAGIDATLLFPGVITGTVTDTAGLPLDGVFVSLVGALGDGAGASGGAITAADGTYTIAAFPWASYRLWFFAPPPKYTIWAYPDQYYRAVSTLAAATPIAVTERGTVRGINAVMGGPLDGGPPPPTAGHASFLGTGKTGRRFVMIWVSCVGGGSCAGRLVLRTSLPKRLRHGRRQTTVTLYSARRTIAADDGALKLKLSRAARRIIAYKRSYFSATVRFTSATGTITKTVRITRVR